MFVAQNIFFYLFAVITVAASVYVVTAKNVVRAALALATAMLGLSGIFILVGSEFLAWVQVMIYIGGAMVLILFGIMMTKAPIGDSKGSYKNFIMPLATSVLVFAAMVWKLFDLVGGQTKFNLKNSWDQERFLSAGSIDSIADTIMADYVVPLEILGVLLLVVVVGATVISKREGRKEL